MNDGAGRCSTAIVWFRDDLRIADNPALAAAAATGLPIVATYILDEGSDRRPLGAASRWWLHHSLEALARDLAAYDVPLVLRRGDPAEVLPELVGDTAAAFVSWNRRYGRAETDLDASLKKILSSAGVHVETRNGSLLVEPWSVANKAGEPFRVFSPFWRSCEPLLNDIGPPLAAPSMTGPAIPIASDDLAAWALLPTRPDWAGGLRETWTPGENGARARLERFLDVGLSHYASDRDKPASEAVSMLSPHLRFGEISVRRVLAAVRGYADVNGIDTASVDKFVSELGWREFSYHLLFHFPDLATRNFQPRFDHFPWRSDAGAEVEAWCRGRTGYPMVDAGMRQLWRTGYMHNRVRMIVASFLVKDLLVDWRVGEDWFWDTLVDADAANNAASWQWVAGSGADAAPYFRIFNPTTQGEKFDPDGRYIRTHVDELKAVPAPAIHANRVGEIVGARNQNGGPPRIYPQPIVDHAKARDRALAAFERLKQTA